MRIVADESVDQPIVDALRQDGHSVLAVADLAGGISDDAVLNLANQEQCTLLTADTDFGELIFRLRRVSRAVILLRLAGLSPERKAQIVSAAVARWEPELEDCFAVIQPGSIRIRRLLS